MVKSGSGVGTESPFACAKDSKNTGFVWSERVKTARPDMCIT